MGTKSFSAKISSVLLAVVAASLVASSLRAAPAAGPKTFDTPKQAVDALVEAAARDDVPALLEILGPDGKAVVSSGEPAQDKKDRAWFVERARKKVVVSEDPFNQQLATFSIGDDEWPSPLPLVEKNGKWSFDAREGRQQTLARRIGSNELDVIAVCRGYVEAQLEYASEDRVGSGITQYAQKVMSTPGKHDGLYWKDPDGSTGGSSPVGETVAKAIAEGYKAGDPYHGYFFRVLKGQGPAAPMGRLDYVIKGAMIGGFAMVAWPAKYRVTGVQTFIVSHDGIVYQKDLGPDTAKIVSAMTLYNPDKTWHETDDEE
jgi:hypothetical protein